MRDNRDQEMQLSHEEKKATIVRQLADTEINLASVDIETKIDSGFKLPLDRISELGVAFGSLPEVFRTITGTVTVPTLLQATDKFGNPLNPSILQKFKDGTGSMGSFRDAANGFSQARLHVADPGAITAAATAPFDPTMLFMAAALSQINKKLDAIQETQEEMFEYMRQKDKAALRGNLETLADILNGYRYNWDNDTWRENAHMKVVDIKQESNKDILHLRSQITGKLNKKGLVEVRFIVDKRMEEVLDRLKEYQIAVYDYAFASFLEPLLSENFREDYLSAIADKISNQSLRYRELYTICYNVFESNTKGSVDAMLLGGLSFAGKKLGEAVAATPIGGRTRIDGALEDVGDAIGEFNGAQSKLLVERLRQVKSPNVLPFKESIDSINRLYNKPMQLLADKDNIYLIPAEE